MKNKKGRCMEQKLIFGKNQIYPALFVIRNSP